MRGWGGCKERTEEAAKEGGSERELELEGAAC